MTTYVCRHCGRYGCSPDCPGPPGGYVTCPECGGGGCPADREACYGCYPEPDTLTFDGEARYVY